MKNPELKIYQRRLPHWRFEGSVYFISWHLNKNQEPLKPIEKDLIMSAIKYFDGNRYTLYAYVVMHDHAHVLIYPKKENQLKDILHSWKSFTGHKLCNDFGRNAPVWQDEYFDRIVRNDSEFMEKADYILNNPRKKWPEINDYRWVGFIGDR